MLKGTLIAAAGAFVAAVLAASLTGPPAIAEAPKCKNKANKYVACTDKLKESPRRSSAGRDFLTWQRGDPPAQKKPAVGHRRSK